MVTTLQYNTSVPIKEDDQWMECSSAAGVIRQFGIDPNVVLSRSGILLTPEGHDRPLTPVGAHRRHRKTAVNTELQCYAKATHKDQEAS